MPRMSGPNRDQPWLRDPYDIAGVWPSVSLLYESDEYVLGFDSEEWDGIDRDVRQAGIRAEARKRAHRYLAMNGASVWARVDRSLLTSEPFVESEPASSLVSSVTATELVIRYLLLRPLIAGLVFDTKFAMRLIRDPFGNQHALDRKLLPAACRAWGIDLESAELPNGQPLWHTHEQLVVVRNHYVHRADKVTVAQAQGGYDCAMGLIENLVQPLVSGVGLAWPPTEWSVNGRTHDPVEENYDYMGS